MTTPAAGVAPEAPMIFVVPAPTDAGSGPVDIGAAPAAASDAGGTLNTLDMMRQRAALERGNN